MICFFVSRSNSIKQIFVVIFDMATFHINISSKVIHVQKTFQEISIKRKERAALWLHFSPLLLLFSI